MPARIVAYHRTEELQDGTLIPQVQILSPSGETAGDFAENQQLATHRDFDIVRAYTRMCAWALARAHARSGDAAMISGYMGSSEAFDDAIGEFAVEYADQNERDYRAFVKAAREGRIELTVEAQQERKGIRIGMSRQR